MRTDAQILIVERREKREMRNVNAHACSPQRFGQSFSTIFFTVDTFSWHVLCVRAFFASAASIIDQTKVENLKPQRSILYPSFLAYSTPPVDVIAGFSDGQKNEIKPTSKGNVRVASANYHPVHTIRVHVCVSVWHQLK